jgi:N-methylhydantoinase A
MIEGGSSYSLGIDIGGTFTDVVVYDHARGRQLNRKVLTTHDDPARAVAAGVATLLARDQVPPAAFARVVHATTLFTNALIERRGAVTGLLTTAGFADTLEIGRERKFELYDLNIVKPEPLVPRDRRLEVTERLRADGTVLRRLDTRQLAAQARRLAAAGVTSIAVVCTPTPIRATRPRPRGSSPAATPGWRSRPRTRWRRRSASTSAPRRRSPMPTSSRWPVNI